MSHIGSKHIKLPDGVIININHPSISINGPLGVLKTNYKYIEIVHVKDGISNYLEVKIDNTVNTTHYKQAYILWGTYRTLIDNMITGVTQGFSTSLELVGVGYKAILLDRDRLSLKIGNSIDNIYIIPDDVKIECIKSNLIHIAGIDKQRVRQVAAEIRSYRIPEPYKGKGIRYLNEIVKLKVGKKK